jgi:hypothetical protein
MQSRTRELEDWRQPTLSRYLLTTILLDQARPEAPLQVVQDKGAGGLKAAHSLEVPAHNHSLSSPSLVFRLQHMKVQTFFFIGT